jgi:hypothetical protein
MTYFVNDQIDLSFVSGTPRKDVDLVGSGSAPPAVICAQSPVVPTNPHVIVIEPNVALNKAEGEE